jgi:hypothetical protein
LIPAKSEARIRCPVDTDAPVASQINITGSMYCVRIDAMDGPYHKQNCFGGLFPTFRLFFVAPLVI